MSEFIKDCLRAHNEYRAKHGVPPLKLNKEISKFSQSYAEKLLSEKRMSHSGHESYGENLYYVYSTDPKYSLSPTEPVKSWYEEIKFFKFGEEPKDLKASHFTQLVWKDTQEVGIGVAKDKDTVFVVVNYHPPGNYVGEYKDQVLPPAK